MKVAREAGEAVLSGIKSTGLEDESLNRAWFKAFENETGPVAELLNENMPDISVRTSN